MNAGYLASAPEVKETRLVEVKEKLLGLRLIHSTDETNGFHHGIVTHVQHTSSESVGHTFELDKSLDMDSLVFFSWPFAPDSQNYGGNKILVSANLLLDEHCFVTPRDWFESARPDEDELGNPIELPDEEQERQELVYEDFYDGTSYHELSDSIENPEPTGYQDIHIPAQEVKHIREKIMLQLENNYFGKIVSGKVWLEYAARMLAARGLDDLPLGEIKFYGKVTAGKIEASVSAEEFDDTYVPHAQEILKKA